MKSLAAGCWRNFALFQKDLRGCLFDPRTAAPRLLGLYRDGLLDLEHQRGSR
jgi:hypothetical protein